MKFMLMMHAPRGNDADYAIMKWPAAALKAHIDFMKNLNKDLKARGEWVSGEGLAPPSQARTVTAKPSGGYEVTDGPFAETKEFLAGYWILDLESKERAYEIAGYVSTAPDPDGKPICMTVEVREVMSAPA